MNLEQNINLGLLLMGKSCDLRTIFSYIHQTPERIKVTGVEMSMNGREWESVGVSTTKSLIPWGGYSL